MKHGANFNGVERLGFTPLDLARTVGHVENIAYLQRLVEQQELAQRKSNSGENQLASNNGNNGANQRSTFTVSNRKPKFLKKLTSEQSSLPKDPFVVDI